MIAFRGEGNMQTNRRARARADAEAEVAPLESAAFKDHRLHGDAEEKDTGRTGDLTCCPEQRTELAIVRRKLEVLLDPRQVGYTLEFVAWKKHTRSIMLDDDRCKLDSSRWKVGRKNLLAVSLPMLTRLVFTVWGAWLGALGLAAALTASGIWNASPIFGVGLSVLMFGAGLGLLIAATIRLIRGPRRIRALAGLLVGTAPFWFLAGHILMAMRPAFNLHVSPGWPSKVFSPLARPLVDLEARWFYPERTPGKWVTMIGAKASDARAQVAAMDRHVEASLARLDQSATSPIVWYRGPIFGLRQCAIHDMAVGSPVGLYRRGADGLTDLDRHEVAHCVINRNDTARSDPPRVLMEGWRRPTRGRLPKTWPTPPGTTTGRG